MFPCSLRYFANVPLFPKTPGRPSLPFDDDHKIDPFDLNVLLYTLNSKLSIETLLFVICDIYPALFGSTQVFHEFFIVTFNVFQMI